MYLILYSWSRIPPLMFLDVMSRFKFGVVVGTQFFSFTPALDILSDIISEQLDLMGGEYAIFFKIVFHILL